MGSSACQTLTTQAASANRMERATTEQFGVWALLQPLQRLAWGFSLNDRLSEDSPVVYLFECMTFEKIVGAIAGWGAQPYMQQHALEKRMQAQGLAWRDSVPWFERPVPHVGSAENDARPVVVRKPVRTFRRTSPKPD